MELATAVGLAGADTLGSGKTGVTRPVINRVFNRCTEASPVFFKPIAWRTLFACLVLREEVISHFIGCAGMSSVAERFGVGKAFQSGLILVMCFFRTRLEGRPDFAGRLFMILIRPALELARVMDLRAELGAKSGSASIKPRMSVFVTGASLAILEDLFFLFLRAGVIGLEIFLAFSCLCSVLETRDLFAGFGDRIIRGSDISPCISLCFIGALVFPDPRFAVCLRGLSGVDGWAVRAAKVIAGRSLAFRNPVRSCFLKNGLACEEGHGLVLELAGCTLTTRHFAALAWFAPKASVRADKPVNTSSHIRAL